MAMQLSNPKYYFQLIGGLLLICLTLSNTAVAQQTEDIHLLADPQNPTANIIEKRVTEIVNHINKNTGWRDFSITGNQPAIGVLNQLVDRKGIVAVSHPKNLRLINVGEDSYEVRDLYVQTSRTDTLEHRQLVMDFNNKGQLIDAGLGAEISNFQLILDRELWATPAQRMEVRRVVNRFQQTLNQRDSAEARKLLAPDVQIVKGYIARYVSDGAYGPYFYYMQQSPEAYALHLKSLSANPDVSYKDLQVYVHPLVKDVYAATYFQRWKSKNYSDKGYVVMIVDLRGDEPLIRVRSWQEYPYETGRLKYHVPNISEVPTPLVGNLEAGRNQLQPVALPKHMATRSPGFFASNKRWLLISVGGTAAISLGVALLTNSGKSELPNPPGRPALH